MSRALNGLSEWGASVASSVALAAALQWLAFRLVAGSAPPVMLAPLLLVLALLHGAAALAGAGDVRRWRVAVALGPAVLALLPLVDRVVGFYIGLYGLTGFLLVYVIAVMISPRLLRAGGDPVVSAGLGALLGAVAAAAAPPDHGLLTLATVNKPLTLTAMAISVLIARDLVKPLTTGPAALIRLRIGALCALPLVVLATRVPATQGPGETLKHDPTRPPIVLIVLDTVRADHLRVYGYDRDTMPRLEQFARRHAIRYERSLSSGSHSFQSHGSMFTGLIPYRHSPITVPTASDPLRYLGVNAPTLATLLGKAGYWTVGISANCGPLVPASGLGRGFERYTAQPSAVNPAAEINPYRGALRVRYPLARLDEFQVFGNADFFSAGVPYRRAREIVDEAVEVISRAGEVPLFLFVNIFDAHAPYRAPMRVTSFPGGRAAPFEREGFSPEWECKLPLEQKERLLSAYDTEIRYLDQELGRLLDALERHPRFDEMLVIITSDHGEGFGEHGFCHHATTLFEEMISVPLFVKPGRVKPYGAGTGASVPWLFQSMDVFPTVLAAARLPLPPDIDGIAWGEHRNSFYAETWPRRDNRSLHLVGEDNLRLIVSSKGEKELYDLGSDPGQRTNVFAERAADAARLQAILSELTSREPGHPAAPGGPASEEAVRSLKALGYLK